MSSFSWSPSLPQHSFDGIIFDCDGTLADTMPLHYHAWCEALGGAAHFFPEPLFYQLGGVPTSHIVELLNKEHQLNLPIQETVERKESIFLSLGHTITAIAPVVSVAEQFFPKIPLAVASGGHRHVVENTLTHLKLTHLFQTIVCSEDYARGKPFPDPFLEAAKRINVAPERCIVFEDTETGLQAAQAAGMHCILVPPAHLR